MSLPSPPGVCRSLSSRLLWLTAALTLAVAAMLFVPALTGARDAWLSRRVSEAEIALLSTGDAGDASLSPQVRDALLRLSGTQEIRAQTPAGRPLVLRPGGPAAPVSQTVDLTTETIPRAVFRTLGAILRGDPDDVAIVASSPMGPGSHLTMRLSGDQLTTFLRRFASAYAVLAIVLAGVAGVLVYAALSLFLVRPMSQIIASIRAFRADPEHAPPAGAAPPRSGSDELSVAAQELAAMQQELRTALWRNARLAGIGTAVAKVSHDLRGILSPALLSAERLQSSPDPATRRVGDIVVRSVERATDLMRETVEYARDTPAGAKRERCAAQTVIAEAAEQVRTAGHRVSVGIDDPGDVELAAESMAMLRIFSNLIRNAAQAGAQSVRVGVATSRMETVIHVADDGHGLPDAVRERLFHPFVTGGARQGTGLGLAIVQELVRAQGGKIELVDSGPGGTTFAIRFSAAVARPRAVQPLSA